MAGSKGGSSKSARSKTYKNLWLQDIKFKEKLRALAAGTLLCAAAAFLFYDSWAAAVLVIPGDIAYFYIWRREMCRKKEREFRREFKDAIQLMAASMSVGYSVENAMRETVKELRLLYKKDCRIIDEFNRMINLLNMNMSVAQAMNDFAGRVRQEDAENFVAVFTQAAKSGGGGIEVIKDAVRDIAEKIEVEEEIQNVLAARKLELKIMCLIPLGIIFYMRFAFSGFMNVLYGNFFGAALMSFCLAAYVAAYFLGKKITDISV